MVLPEITPILKWPGGKRAIAEQVRRKFQGPLRIGARYFEPFAGSLAVYLHRFALGEVQPQCAFLSDLNPRLMSFHWWIQQNPSAVYDALMKLPSGPEWRAAFPDYRNRLNQWSGAYSETTAEDAALYLWFNRACFNGLMRVNASGEHNAPAGSYETLSLPSKAALQRVSQALAGARLSTQSFETIEIQAGDQVYVDPPYYGDGMFDQYTAERFPYAQHLRLALWAHAGGNAGAAVVISNSAHSAVRTVYDSLKFNITEITATRSISCTSEGRGPTGEILVTVPVR